jgi:hypothetical protein
VSIYQFTYHGQAPQGNYWANVFNFLDDDTGPNVGITRATDDGDAINSAIRTTFLNLIPQDCNVLGHTCKKVSAGGGPTYVKSQASPGAIAHNSMAAGISPNIAWFPGVAPWKEGHSYICTAAETYLVEGIWIPTMFSEVANFAAAITAPITASGGNNLQFVIFDRITVSGNIVIDGVLRPKPTLMNRRLKPVTT